MFPHLGRLVQKMFCPTIVQNTDGWQFMKYNTALSTDIVRNVPSHALCQQRKYWNSCCSKHDLFCKRWFSCRKNVQSFVQTLILTNCNVNLLLSVLSVIRNCDLYIKLMTSHCTWCHQDSDWKNMEGGEIKHRK